MSYAVQNFAKGLSFILLILLIAGCSFTPAPDPRGTISTNKPALSGKAVETPLSPNHLALDAARKMIGTPYRYGGNDPRGFDCSGLIQYSFKKAGIKVPRTSQELFRGSQRVSLQDTQPGDLVFFTISSNKIAHVGIYDEHKRFIHSPSTGKGVSYASLENPYWNQRIIAVGRF